MQTTTQTIKIETLLKALKFVKQVIVKNAVIPVLEEFLFIDGKIIASDLNNFIVYNIGAYWGSFTLPANVKGNEGLFEIGFNGTFLLEFAEDVKEEVLSFEFSAPNRAAIINGNRLVMPVMLTDYR
jgi:DNA polymerase III sliding clamp (beta) subunit (PCNA family)